MINVLNKILFGTCIAQYFMSRTEFIYDGWNLISERKYKTNNLSTLGDQQPTTSHYFWGLDVSGSLGGAGGVGGLLQLAVGSNSPYITKKEEKEPGTEIFGPAGSSLQSSVSGLQSGCSIYFPHYDHIGNIIAYTNESEEIAAVYDYSGFGELIRSDGPMKEDFSLQFSTKYIDKETNLYYYGYRFYNPQMGNWLSREPMGESESVNLYTFVDNCPVDMYDVLGLFGDGRRAHYAEKLGVTWDKVPQKLMDANPDNIPKEHSDFAGWEQFDYTYPDTFKSGTSPLYPFLGDPGKHFMTHAKAEEELEEALNSRDADRFRNAMHFAQDPFVHRGKGYEWKPFRKWKSLGLGHALAECKIFGVQIWGHNPDDDPVAWEKANDLTKQYLKKWYDKWGKPKCPKSK